MTQPIGAIRKEELLQLLQMQRQMAKRLNANEAYFHAIADLATATGLAEYLVPNVASDLVLIEMLVKRLGVNDES